MDASRIGRPFKKEAIRQDGWSDIVDVLGRHPTGEETIAPAPDYIGYPIDFRARLFHRQPETPHLRQQVVDAPTRQNL